MRSGKWLLIGGLGLVLFLITVLPAMVQALEPETVQVGVSLRYPVKFVCGAIGGEGPPDIFLPLARGRYHTAINVHNPSLKTTVIFAKKVTLSAYLEPHNGLPFHGPFKPPEFFKAELGGNQSFEIDCQDIYMMLEGVTNGEKTNFNNFGQSFVKGFVVIMSPVELDVTAVYTARPTGAGATPEGSPPDFAQISSMDVEVIQPKPQRGTIAAIVIPPILP